MTLDKLDLDEMTLEEITLNKLTLNELTWWQINTFSKRWQTDEFCNTLMNGERDLSGHNNFF
jgi:hypothetical protein